MAPRKGPADPLNAKKETLAAVVLADSFPQQFRPITVERAKVLLPVVNVPMIDYTLEWLVAGGVEEVLVFCCSHASQVKQHVESSKWSSQRSADVKVIVGSGCRSAGDCLRALDQSGALGGDFVLVCGDVVSNMDLAAVVAEHRARRDTDPHAIMTMVMRPVPDAAQRAWLGADELLVALDPATNRLLRYEPCGSKRRRVKLDTALFGEREAIQLRRDLVDVQIAMCSLEVLVTFSDNFDYQDVQGEFISGVLAEEELGTKLHVHLAEGCYAGRVLNPRSYDAVSRDILQRWAFPYAPDANWSSQGKHATTFALSRQHVYRENEVRISRSAEIGQDCALGSGTHISEGAVVEESVLGRNCRIGKDAQIRGSYLHDDVTIGDNAQIDSALLCQGAVVQEDAVVMAGAIVSFKVVIGPGHTVGPNQRLTLCQQQQAGGASFSDQEQDYSDQEASEEEEAPASPRQHGDKPQAAVLAAAAALAAQQQSPGETSFDIEAVGEDGAGFVWLPQDSLPHSSLAFELPLEEEHDEASSDADSAVSTAETADLTIVDPEASFKREVSETVLRCAQQGFDPSFVVVELNGLKIAEDRTFADCASAILTTLLGLCFPAAPKTKPEYQGLYPAAAADSGTPAGKAELIKRASKQLDAWGPLLLRFLKTEDEQVELVLTLEEFCSGEGSPEAEASHGPALAPVFAQVLKMLYDKEIVAEEAILAWADEKESAEAHERVFLKRAADFLKWLREAEEEEESDDDDGDEDDDEA